MKKLNQQRKTKVVTGEITTMDPNGLFNPGTLESQLIAIVQKNPKATPEACGIAVELEFNHYDDYDDDITRIKLIPTVRYIETDEELATRLVVEADKLTKAAEKRHAAKLSKEEKAKAKAKAKAEADESRDLAEFQRLKAKFGY